ncbi:hypothetical protein T265_05700 [Opisthorchis viverrini]|uniref:Uncharacterized protein n=1 Tax=Opisthorchis viverrini TaxID=6198 RepID=A0A074ZJR2_OPIVI|nr:hypothetical protein T265_05700 [Opisthorchis viverrini]KER27236.1 hypothetical protein T265_05700 [Opisthorchis viverrini]
MNGNQSAGRVVRERPPDQCDHMNDPRRLGVCLPVANEKLGGSVNPPGWSNKMPVGQQDANLSSILKVIAGC